jgi:putative heme-binding domain-containing protein
MFDGLSQAAANRAVATEDAAVRARVAWALGRAPKQPDTAGLLARLTGDEDPTVNRYAWEALATCDPITGSVTPQPAWTRGLNHPLRRVRAAAIDVARGSGAPSYAHWASTIRIGEDAHQLQLAQLWIAAEKPAASVPSPASAEVAHRLAELAASPTTEPELRLESLRLLQLELGDLQLLSGTAEVYAGYQAKRPEAISLAVRAQLAAQLAESFPTDNAELDREFARTLGMLGVSSAMLPDRLSVKWTDGSPLEDDVHYLIVASLLPGERSPAFTAATASSLLGLHHKLSAAEQYTSRNWPLRISEALRELLERDPALPAAIVNHSRLNDPGHAIFVEALPPQQQAAASRRLWKNLLARGAEPTPELIALASRLPAAEAVLLVRPYWEDASLRDAVTLILAKHPLDEDRAKFIEALSSPQPEVVERVAYALPSLGVRHTTDEMAAALRALKAACALGAQPEPRTALMRLLEFWTEDGADVEWDPDPRNQWIGWYEVFKGYYPAAYERLVASTKTDLSDWRSRLKNIAWEDGNPIAGRQVFELRSCHRCHQQSGHLGPELKGAIARMSRDDLFTAILDPNLEVSPTYMTTLIATESGQVYHGLVVYESPESTLLQTGPDTTVRITSTEAAAMRPSSQSLMPTGLLDPLTDQQVADLYAFLKSLGDSGKKQD